MNDQLNSINSIESEKHLPRSQRFVENAKRAVGKVLTKAWIGLNTMLPMASTTTSTVMPASVNTISVVAPTASTVVKAISLWTAASLLTACGGKDDPDGPFETKDITPPTININRSEIDITWWKEIRISWSQLYIWNDLVASRNDDKTRNCSVLLSINWKTITSWTTISEEWTLTIKVSDEAWNIKSTDIKLNIVKNAPSINVNQYEVNIFWWTTVNIKDNQLLFWEEVIASRNDDNLESCKVTLSFNWQDIKSWDTLNEWWTLIITVTNKNSITSTAEITLKNDAIYGLENLKNVSLYVDQEYNLLNWITFADGVELIKTDVEIDGKRNNVSDPTHYTPEYPWTCNVIFTLKWKNGNTAEFRADNITINPLEYVAMEINNIKPEEILPIVWQVEIWDKKAYEHIEHLRVAEATKIRDMMRKYGTSNHSPEEYQQLVKRLNTGMIWEIPTWYNNYEIIWWGSASQPSGHAHNERNILNTIINDQQTNFIIINYDNKYETLYNLAKNNPNSINIFWSSTWLEFDKKWEYEAWSSEKKKWQLRQNNLILFQAWSNNNRNNNILKNKICQGNIDLPDEHSIYGEASLSNSKSDSKADIHQFLTFGTNKEWDVDLTDETTGSKFPIWFHDDVLFSWRSFPHKETDNKIHAESWNLTTSYPNYFNVSLMDICFQLFPKVKDVDELLNMVKSTALTNYIRRDNKTQKLILINPAWLIKKYIMPTNLPTNIQSSETKSLSKWYYKWVIFDIPGAEVKINWQWITYNNTNKSIIKNQNPMNLEWRINWNLCKKMWYMWKNLSWKIIIVDDKRNSLNIQKEITIKVQ